jgi:hypothetical protein
LENETQELVQEVHNLFTKFTYKATKQNTSGISLNSAMAEVGTWHAVAHLNGLNFPTDQRKICNF